MRNDPLNIPRMSVAEYLAFEAKASVRHEYVHGDVYAMTGTTIRHNRIVQNLVGALVIAGKGGPCQTLFLDLRVRAGENAYYYPDVVTTCKAQNDLALDIDEPCLIVEVASTSTRRTDRSEKLLAYESISSMWSYLIVEQHRRLVTHYSRSANGEWTRADHANAGLLAIPCPETVLTLEQIYDGIELAPLRVGEAPAGDNGWLVFDEVDAR